MCQEHELEKAIMLEVREKFRPLIWIYEGCSDQTALVDNPLQFVLDGGFYDGQSNIEFYSKFSKTLCELLEDVHIDVYNPGTEREYYAIITTYDEDTELDGNAHAGSEGAMMYTPTGECFTDMHDLAMHIEHDDPDNYKRILYELFMSGEFIPMKYLSREELLEHYGIPEGTTQDA